MCGRAGLALEAVYAGYDGAPFDGDSFRYVLVARKPR
jgi:hypothetical protein